MGEPKVISVIFSEETPKQSMIWLHQLIIRILIKQLQLDPKWAGDLIKSSSYFYQIINSSFEATERRETNDTD